MDKGFNMETIADDKDAQQDDMKPPEMITCCGVVRENYLDYTEETSCHGLSHITDRGRGVVRRIIWAVCFLSMLGVLLQFAITQALVFIDKPVFTKIVYAQNESLVFPSVTVCNLNMATASAIAVQHPYTAELIKLLGQNQLNADIAPHLLEHAKRVDMHQLIVDTAPTMSGSYITCMWDSLNVPCADYLTPTMTQLGLCYTFNDRDTIQKKGPLTMKSAGSMSGLRLRMSVHQEEYSALRTGYGAGFKLLVHSPWSQPLVGTSGNLISPGQETEISISLFEENRLGPPYDSACLDTLAPTFRNPLKFFDDYSRDSCNLECYIRYLTDACGCVPYTANLDNQLGMTYCSVAEYINCTQPTMWTFQQDPSIMSTCACERSCKTQRFQTSVSSAMLPNSYTSADMSAKFNMTKDQLRENIVEIKVYYSDFSFQQLQEYPAYTIETLGGDIGGMMGLCLGCSVLTIVEFGEFLLLMCHTKKKQKGEPNK